MTSNATEENAADLVHESPIVPDNDIPGDVEQKPARHLELTEEERRIERRVRRKIDLRIMPVVILVFLMNYIDRNNYAAARLQGLEADLHLVGNEYQTGLSVLFVGYILSQIFSNLLLNFCGRPSLFLGFFTGLWGLISALTALVQNYQGLVACRFFLGLVESPFFAGVMFYLSKWYVSRMRKC